MANGLSAIRSNRFRKSAAPYIFISPFFILFLTFGAFPIFYALYLSFHKWSGGATTPMVFCGWDNYVGNIQDPLFWQSLGNTFYLAVLSSLPQHIMGMFFAFVLNLGFVKLRDFFKASFFLPYITAGVSIAIIFGIIFAYQYGIINYFLISICKMPVLGQLADWIYKFMHILLFGFQWLYAVIANLFLTVYNLIFHASAHVAFPTFMLNNLISVLPWKWLGQTSTIVPTISSLIIWQWTGWNTILYLAALQAIPIELYEAARVDGAKWHQVFFKITLPSIKPMMQFAATMSVIGGMTIFSEPYIMVGKDGGVGHSGFTAAMNIYQSAFEFNFFGWSSALCYLLFVIILLLYLVTRRLIRSDEGVA